MSVSLKELEEQIRLLPAEDRARLIEILLESLHSPDSEIEAEWTREIEERVAAFDRGEVPAYAAEDVFAEARRLAR
jgi:putative addiction module component (TIGR02574 family)